MKRALFFILLAMPVLASGQDERFRDGYIIDKFGEKYSGLIKIEPGDGKKPGQLVFKESKKGKKETYGPDYVRSFVVESDSFAVLQNIPLANRKTLSADFARVMLVGSGGVLYSLETEVLKSSGHATTAYKVAEEKIKYVLDINGKLIGLTQSNMKDFATIIADDTALHTKVLSRKIKFQDLNLAVEEYKTFSKTKSQP